MNLSLADTTYTSDDADDSNSDPWRAAASKTAERNLLDLSHGRYNAPTTAADTPAAFRHTNRLQVTSSGTDLSIPAIVIRLLAASLELHS
jgi:hypothetical protein